jgi:lysozyme
MANTARGGKAPLVALIAAASVIAAPLVMKWEGKRNATYLDPVKIPTVCFGHTGPDVKMGQWRTDAECEALLNEDLRKHAEGAARCTPTIFQNPKIAAAVVSFTYNVGENAYCKSTAAKRFNTGDLRGGCEALGWYVYANGKKLRGLERRRAAEVKLCLEGLK